MHIRTLPTPLLLNRKRLVAYMTLFHFPFRLITERKWTQGVVKAIVIVVVVVANSALFGWGISPFALLSDDGGRDNDRLSK